MSLAELSFAQPIGYPGAAMWDGKYVALDDQRYDDEQHFAVYEASLSGSTLTRQGTAVIENTCGSGEDDVVQPFIVGNENTPVNTERGKVLVAENNQCLQALGLWHYPAGNDPFKTIAGPDLPYGESVSIAR